MVLYCHVADEGGATTFSNADVTVVPRKYQASFFSYMDENGIMDEGALSEHSGCLISKGEKWITTMWMRKGVSSEDPWSHFDPSGIRYKTSKK